MVLLAYKEWMNMVIMGQVQGRQMIDICCDVIEANKMDDKMNKGYGFGDTIFEMYQQLEATDISSWDRTTSWSSTPWACPLRWKSSTTY